MNQPMSPFLKQKCIQLTNSFMKSDTFYVFKNKVELSEAKDYLKIVKEPMCLNEVMKRLKSDRYKKFSEYVYDMNLIWSNCILYNGEQSSFGFLANFGKYRMNKKLENFSTTIEEEFINKLKKYSTQILQYNQTLQKELDHTPTNYEVKYQ